MAFARRALDAAIGCLERETPLVDRLELEQVVDEFDDYERNVETYAIENRLVRDDSAGLIHLTGLGQVFLRLRGKDAVRWLLTIEVGQSRGFSDPWRASNQLLEQALSDAGVERLEPWIPASWGYGLYPFSTRTLKRLASLDVLTASLDVQGAVRRYSATNSMRDVVRAVLETGPWHAAVAAQLEDERATALRAPGPSAADATIEQTRMIAHEVRNALIPVRHHIDALLAAVAGPAERDRIEASLRGVGRVLSFVDELVATSELLDEPTTLCDVADIVSEALGWVDAGGRVELVATPLPLRTRAPRSRLARAIVNVVTNALQATTDAQRVRVSTIASNSMVEIRVDDGGPGVPDESLGRIFDDGFTTRPGGSGFGLAFVRTVVEGRLRGKVWCEASDLGGARFVITIPEAVEP